MNLVIFAVIAVCCCLKQFSPIPHAVLPSQVDFASFGASLVMNEAYLAIASLPFMQGNDYHDAFLIIYEKVGSTFLPLSDFSIPGGSSDQELKSPHLSLSRDYISVSTDKVRFSSHTLATGFWINSVALDNCTWHKAFIDSGERVLVMCDSSPQPVHIYTIDAVSDPQLLIDTNTTVSTDAALDTVFADGRFFGMLTANGTNWEVKIFAYNDATASYDVRGILTAPHPEAGRHFQSFAISNTTLVVSEMSSDDSRLYVFHLEEDQWGLVVDTLPAIPTEHGYSFDSPGLRVAVSAHEPPFIHVIGTHVPAVFQLVKDDSGWSLAFNSLNTLMPNRPQNAAMFDDLLVQTFETTQADTSNIVVYQQIERSGKFQPVGSITSEAIAGISDGFIRAHGAYAAVGLPGNPQRRVFGVTELMQVQEVETSFFRRTFNQLKGSAPAELAIDTLQRVDPMQKTFSSEFGSRVTISRDMMAISAPGASEGMGGVFFFQNQSSYFEPIPWKDNGQLMVWPPGESIVRFGSNILELYVDDTASGFLVAGTENNVLYVYPIENGYLPHGDTNAFSLMPAPVPSDAFYFGTDIAIHDHLFVIGSRNSQFYVATMDEKWKMTNMVTIASPSPDNIQFGYYVSIRGDGTKIATSDVSSTASGCTFGSVFERTDNGWVYSAALHAPKSTGRQELCSNSVVHVRYQESSVLIADGYNGSTGRIRRFDPKPRSSQFTPSVIDVPLEYGQVIIDMSVSDELLLYSTANPTGLFALFPVIPDHTGMAFVLLVLFVIFTTAVVVSFLTGIFCIQLALFALTTIGCGLSVKRLQAWDIRRRKKIFAKSELAKLDIRRQDRYKFSAIVDFYIAKEEITETQVVATGGIGSVSCAVYRNSVVCVKKLHDAFQTDEICRVEFAREAKTLVELSHPNVLRFIGCMVDGLAIKIVTEYCALGSLSSYVKQLSEEGELSFKTLLDLIIQAAVGLEYIHSRGIVHRDIKPDNFFVSVEEKIGRNKIRVKVGDLGLAVDPKGRTSINVGTMGFAAPEVLGRMAYDQKADVFSFAMTIFALIEGVEPFINATTSLQITNMILHGIRPEFGQAMLGDECQDGLLAARHNLHNLIREMWVQDSAKRPSMKVVVRRLREIRKKAPEARSRTYDLLST